MNNKCFRVIFSKTLQHLIVTSELAKTEGRLSELVSDSLSSLFCKILLLTFSLFCTLGSFAFSDYTDNKQADDSLKNKTLHQLSLSNVSVQNDALSVQGSKTLGGLNSLGSASFTSLGGTAYRVDALGA